MELMNQDNDDEEIRLEVYSDKSVLVKDGDREVFEEGTLSSEAEDRHEEVREELEDGFLRDLVEEIEDPEVSLRGELEENKISTIEKVVETITSQRGRGIAGLLFLQMTIKSITPEQSIRLHKGSNSSRSFSWVEGISMRGLDTDFTTPFLRDSGLLKVNRDGVMMTRSLAENYPYSKVYKPEMRGAKDEWLTIVEWLEDGDLDPKTGLKYLISSLIKRKEDQEALEEDVLNQLDDFLDQFRGDEEDIKSLISSHLSDTDGAARLLEVALHALYQVAAENGKIEGELAPLSQMRSADKKAGVVGDVEIWDDTGIVEALDAKFGKAYFLNEVKELNDKLVDHEETESVTFITDLPPSEESELRDEIENIESEFEVQIEIKKFSTHLEDMLEEIGEGACGEWLMAYVESLAQERREIAPIDEPCSKWLESLLSLLDEKIDAEPTSGTKALDDFN